MYEKTIPYTEKFPLMYQVYLKGYMIQTTNKENFHKLMEYLKANCNNDSYADLPASKRTMIECNYTVKKVDNISYGLTLP